MKIAVWHNLPSGGGKRALYNHIKGLVERGHTVEAWCPSTADRSYLPLSDLVLEHVLPFEWKAAEVDRPVLRYRRAYKNALTRLEAMDQHCEQCACEIHEGGFDLLFANSCMFFRVSSIGRFVKIPRVIYLQEPYRPLYESMPRLPWLALPAPDGRARGFSYWRDFVYNLIQVQALRVQAREERLNAEMFDGILVNSLFSRESVLRAYGLESRVCHLGVDTEQFRPTGATRENYVVGVGGVYYGKGIDRAVRAIGAVDRSKRPRLLWVGDFMDESHRKDLEKLADHLGVNLAFKICLTDDELVEIMNGALAMIYCSRLEPFGLAPLEANACGTPVIAIAEGGVRETIVDGLNGFLVPTAEPKVVGEALLRLLDDPALAARMGATARQHVVQNWSLSAAANRLEDQLISYCNHEEHLSRA